MGMCKFNFHQCKKNLGCKVVMISLAFQYEFSRIPLVIRLDKSQSSTPQPCGVHLAIPLLPFLSFAVTKSGLSAQAAYAAASRSTYHTGKMHCPEAKPS